MDRNANLITRSADFGYSSFVREPSQNIRRRLVESGLFLAEEIIARPDLPPSGNTSRRQLVITYAGAFEFQVGRSISWVDTSRILFAEANQSYVDRHVVPRTGHRSLILGPSPGAMEELWGTADAHFSSRVRACTLRAQMLVQRLRRVENSLAAEELGVALMEESVVESRRVNSIDPACVRRAKAALHDCPDGRISLGQIASDLGVTPIYLTQAFKRSEGIPLYRYQTVLRLGRALNQLPERNDITDLAFELGFSSHSHFTAAFRSELGTTPSRYRAETRTARLNA